MSSTSRTGRPTTGRTPFGATTKASEVLAGVDLHGRRAIVTGAAGGIGRETARALAAAGAEVVLAVRDVSAGEHTARVIRAAVPSVRVGVVALDLSDPRSVAAMANRWDGPLHMLINNAGVMATPEMRNAQGWEIQFATNHLGHFQLANLLHPWLARTPGSRVVSVSSVGHVNGDVDLADPQFERRPYDPWAAYSQSKTANILFAVEAARRWAHDGIAVNALNPGRIADTGLGRHHTPAPTSFDPAGSTGVSVKNVEQGAATSVLLAASPLVEGVSGRYFEDCNPAEPFRPGVRRGVADYALDAGRAQHLWQLSEELLASAGTPVSDQGVH